MFSVREMDWLQLPLYHKCHVLSESQCVEVGFIVAWVDEACQNSELAGIMQCIVVREVSVLLTV